jgi:alkaline phosphatase
MKPVRQQIRSRFNRREISVPLLACIGTLFSCLLTDPQNAQAQDDYLAQLQLKAAMAGKAGWGHWGPLETTYAAWSSHSNRLVPIYTFGIDLKGISGQNSTYRDAARLKELYGAVPTATLNPDAAYFDQTDVYRLQKMAVGAGKKYVILMVFDGMDWQTTQAAAIYRAGRVAYSEGRGTGLKFQDYRGVDTDYGYFVPSPNNAGTKCNVDTQTLNNPGGDLRGGYDWQRAGDKPWSTPNDPLYPIGTSLQNKQAYPDSAATATALCSGTKTYNDAINFDPLGRQSVPLARDLQKQGFAIGVVTSVPISHATPACAYANNVHRDDYQDLSRDLLGLPSITHPDNPLPGVDVLMGTGWGVEQLTDAPQGKNYVPGNRYLPRKDLATIDVGGGGKYYVAQRTGGVPGGTVLTKAVDAANQRKSRLLGFFGTKAGHLPNATADGRFDPVLDGVGLPTAVEQYKRADIEENPTLAQMAVAALDVLAKRSDSFWLMVEAGDVDWANHKNNIDNSIGAVISGDLAFTAMTDWIEAHHAWDRTALIVTADHGHYLVLEKPEALVPPKDATE